VFGNLWKSKVGCGSVLARNSQLRVRE
jgi:hypothetical protein